MTSVRSLAWLHCATCDDTTLHDYNRCRKCQTPNNSSGNPPVPKPKSAHLKRSAAGEARRVEALRAYHAARRARNNFQRGRT